MTATARLSILSDAIQAIGNDDHRIECSMALMSGEQNATDSLSTDKGEQWAALVIASIESTLEDKPSTVQSFFKEFGVSF